MPKRNLIPKMVVAVSPALLPLAAMAHPGEGRNPLPPAPVTAQRSQPGPAVTTAHLPAVTANAAVKPTAEIAVHAVGRVLLPQGGEAAHAAVCIGWIQNDGKQRFQKTVCDANGKFDVPLTLTPIGTINNVGFIGVNITALVPGKGLAWTQRVASREGMEPVQLKLLPGTTLEGRLLKPDGSPASGTDARLAALLPRILTRSGVPDTAEETKPEDSRQQSIQKSSFARFMPLLPEEDIAALFHATADANGRFILHGVPCETSVTLETGGKLALASGSSHSFVVLDREWQNAGLFVATPTGRFKARVVDATTGKPIPPTYLSISAANSALNPALVQQTHRNPGSLNRPTDSQGEYVSPELLPGEYDIHVMGCVKRVRVEANRETPPVEFALRHGALKGRLLDADGNPVANAEIRMAAIGAGFGQSGFGQTIFFNGDAFNGFPGGRHINTSLFFVQDGRTQIDVSNLSTVTSLAAGGVVNLANQVLAKTGADGSFTIHAMPWGSPGVHIWAMRGNDLAEWTGPAGKLDATLTLKMRRDALVSVTGRLIDPERRPVANVHCKAIHWLATPRSTWFATAREVQTDKDGNFTVSGLERGESFSLITLGHPGVNNMVQIDGPIGPAGPPASEVKTALNGPGVVFTGAVPVAPGIKEGASPGQRLVMPIVQEFESPRFKTCAAGDGQSLGEVMVHPQDTPEEVMQSYGGSGSFGDQPVLPGIVATPTPANVREAQQALARFESALKSGDAHTLEQLTSRVSPGWSANKPEFLQNVSLCGRTDGEGDAQTTQPLRFVPRDAVAALLQAAPDAAQSVRSELDNGGDTTSQEANWVFLAKPQGDKIVLAGVLHRENGQWRVVANPSFTTPESLQMVHSRAPQIAREAWTQSASALDTDLQTAQQAGEKYLQTWLAGDKQALFALTSPNSSLAASDVNRFRHLLEKRKDDGVCPLATGEKTTLQPVSELTLWEQAWLKLVAGTNGAARFEQLTRRLSEATASQMLQKADIEAARRKGAAGSDMAVFHYTAQGHDFLMLLTRSGQQWQMLEPALPL